MNRTIFQHIFFCILVIACKIYYKNLCTTTDYKKKIKKSFRLFIYNLKICFENHFLLSKVEGLGEAIKHNSMASNIMKYQQRLIY